MRYLLLSFSLFFLSSCCVTKGPTIFPPNAVIQPMEFRPEGTTGTGPDVKILYLHGMSASDYCGSYEPVKAILKQKWGTVTGDDCIEQEDLDLGLPEPMLHYGSELVSFDTLYDGDKVYSYWDEGKDKVGAAEPSLRSYTLSSNEKLAEVYELNYWPLLVFMKCKTIISSEALLTGGESKNASACKRILGIDIDTSEAGRGPKINKALKKVILEWGFSDAVLSLGDVGDINRKSVLKAIQIARGEDGNTTPLHIITASLGSYVLTDALIGDFLEYDTTEINDVSETVKSLKNQSTGLFTTQSFTPQNIFPSDTNRQNILSNLVKWDTYLHDTSVYMFANQIALLSLADIYQNNDLKKQAEVERKNAIVEAILTTVNFDQFVAFNEFGDLLTYQTPNPFLQLRNIESDTATSSGDNIRAYNVNLQFAPSLFGLVSNPLEAHTEYHKSKDVRKIIIEGYRAK